MVHVLNYFWNTLKNGDQMFRNIAVAFILALAATGAVSVGVIVGVAFYDFMQQA